jgi:hypothetical protein
VTRVPAARAVGRQTAPVAVLAAQVREVVPEAEETEVGPAAAAGGAAESRVVFPKIERATRAQTWSGRDRGDEALSRA